ncbi:oxygenase MpaB family protein [Parvularcula sp. LCG005]|uniref:oxygenase MpaB family protein n=1 Tax=Parvularcula sp. LCG005 TaxID=3078805 RepID=UPI00294200F2|nr:oxygenase MpaB family protein [Parvularcula sp. LCG005]WOI52242.1 oxygenase MpaB family protein [Parvularcula sp. LCG005]
MWPLKPYVERVFQEFLVPDGVPPYDFRQPPGEAAVVPADSVSWRVFRNPITLFIGGVAAVLMELAEPRVCHGVWTHSSFRTDPKARLQRTGLAAMISVYGAESSARRMIAGVQRRHGVVTGEVDGVRYTANDVELLNWVNLTASYGFLSAYDAYAKNVDLADQDKFFSEAARVGEPYGASGLPLTREGADRYLTAMSDQLRPSPAIHEFLALMRTTRILPVLSGVLQPMLIQAAIDIVPDHIRQRIDIGEATLSSVQRAAVRQIAVFASDLVVEAAPSVQACQRLNLPADYLYRR